MPSARLSVWYRATPEDGAPQVHEIEDLERAWEGAEAFMRDLFGLEGQGVRKLTVEVT